MKTIFTQALIIGMILGSTNAQNLKAYYTFTGNADDISGNGRNGTVNSASLTTDMFGNTNQAYSFNGSSSSITVPGQNFQFNSYTYSMWVKVNNNPSSGNVAAPICIGTPSTANQSILLANNALGSTGWIPVSYYNTTSSDAAAATGTLPTTGVWYHLAMVRDSTGDSLILYINGSRASAVSLTSGTAAYGASPSTSVIGSRGVSQYFDGVIDNVRIYNTALTASKINDIYYHELSSGLVGFYPFTGNANDVSGNGYNGTASNTSLATDRFGNTNRAYNFNGSSSSVTVPGQNFQFNSYTYSMWVKVNNNPSSGNVAATICIGTPSTANQSILLANNALGSTGWIPVSYYNTTSSDAAAATGTLPTANVWYHLVMVRNTSNSSLTLYIDGSSVVSTSLTSGTAAYGASPSTSVIGSRGVVQYFDGIIDDVRIYNFAMTASEVQSLYETPLSNIIATGIEKQKENRNLISVYPNPSSGTINVSAPQLNSSASLKIYTAQGQLVYSISDFRSEMQIEHLTKGIYLCSLEQNGMVISTSRFIISE